MREPIQTLRRRLPREQAIEKLSGGIAGGARSLTRGPLRVVADLYVPFGLYRATIRTPTTHERAVLGIDLVEGALDLYRFEGPVVPDQIEEIWTRNHVPAAIPPAAAEEAIRSRLQRLAYRRNGFLAGGKIIVDVEPTDAIVHVPYWAGFFGRGDRASLVIIDAVRCAVEGPKVRRLISRWLTVGATIPDPSNTEQAAARL